MSAKLYVPLGISVFWLVIGFVVPLFIPKGPNQGVTQVMLMLTAVCCWVLWLSTYIAQLNPLFGPQVSNITMSMMYHYKF